MSRAFDFGPLGFVPLPFNAVVTIFFIVACALTEHRAAGGKRYGVSQCNDKFSARTDTPRETCSSNDTMSVHSLAKLKPSHKALEPPRTRPRASEIAPETVQKPAISAFPDTPGMLPGPL